MPIWGSRAVICGQQNAPFSRSPRSRAARGVARGPCGSAAVVARNGLSAFSAKSGFSGVKFRADVAIDDIEFHYLLIRRNSFWGEAEVWLLGRPRLMKISN